MAKFEIVSRFADQGLALPARATARAAGYDLCAAEDILVPSYSQQMNYFSNIFFSENKGKDSIALEDLAAFTKKNKIKPTLVSTGMKIQLDDDEYLELSARSSTPLKYWLIVANSVGIIDADYYNNSGNEGEIFFQLINLSPVPIKIQKGDFIGQGIIHKYGKVEGDSAEAERVGGMGSTH